MASDTAEPTDGPRAHAEVKVVLWIACQSAEAENGAVIIDSQSFLVENRAPPLILLPVQIEFS